MFKNYTIISDITWSNQISRLLVSWLPIDLSITNSNRPVHASVLIAPSFSGSHES